MVPHGKHVRVGTGPHFTFEPRAILKNAQRCALVAATKVIRGHPDSQDARVVGWALLGATQRAKAPDFGLEKSFALDEAQRRGEKVGLVAEAPRQADAQA